MTKLLITLAVLTAVATPALAQSYDNQPASSQGANNVYSNQGHILLGRDPDPQVRQQLLKDYGAT